MTGGHEVVVTGTGVLCATASDTDTFAQALRAGRSWLLPAAARSFSAVLLKTPMRSASVVGGLSSRGLRVASSRLLVLAIKASFSF